MSHANRKKLRFTAATIAAGAIAVAGTTLGASWAVIAQAAPASAAASAPAPAQASSGATASGATASASVLASQATGTMTSMTNMPSGATTSAHAMKLKLNLSPMPEGTITTGITAAGQQFVEVDVYGLTPGSAHEVTLRQIPVGTLTADATGQATATFNVQNIKHADRVRILDGGAGTSVIAVSAATGTANGPYALQAVESGFPSGTMHGQATFVYDPETAKITVTLSATGVSPGLHAAHIHLGSCASQGGVQYMLMDFTANDSGQINDETRVVTNVKTPPPAVGWYLNLHQGNSNNILDSAGNPTIYFRPLLCANIVAKS